jgi:predicted nucleic-acid-binding protein
VTGLDSNILLRYFLYDDPKQSLIAERVIDSLTPDSPGWIAVTTLVEIVWALSAQLRVRREPIARILKELLTENAIVVDRRELVERALHFYRTTKADFADCIISVSAKSAGCNRVLTFDENAARDLGMELAE